MNIDNVMEKVADVIEGYGRAQGGTDPPKWMDSSEVRGNTFQAMMRALGVVVALFMVLVFAKWLSDAEPKLLSPMLILGGLALYVSQMKYRQKRKQKIRS